VVKVKLPHSYFIDMGDGSVRKVHANKIANLWHVFKDVESLLKKMPNLVVF